MNIIARFCSIYVLTVITGWQFAACPFYVFFFFFFFFFFLHWHYSPLWVLACRTMSLHFVLSPTLSIFSLPALEDLFLLLLSILSWAVHFVSSLLVLAWRPFWASYPPPFSPGNPTNLYFAPLSILLYFILYSSLLVLDSSYFSIPHFHPFYAYHPINQGTLHNNKPRYTSQ